MRAFERRLNRVADGLFASALDEFLGARVPIQLGGLHDPFTPRERMLGVTLRLLKILRDRKYPTLISTKGDLVAEQEYLDLLKEMMVVVRFSAAGVSERYRLQIDRRCADFDRTLEKISKLARNGVVTALRIQPVIPGFEQDALDMARKAAAAGARRISFEYLKLPKESVANEIKILSSVVGFDLLKHMSRAGLSTVGWDYSLISCVKRPFVLEARKVCHSAGVSFGAGDTDFIPLSDGDGCCGSTSDLLPGSSQFKANLSGIVKLGSQGQDQKVRFDQLKTIWAPQRPISTYLDTRSRGPKNSGHTSDWLSLLARRWNGECGPYSPDFFYGVNWQGECDRDGMRIYDASELADALTPNTNRSQRAFS